MSKILFPNISTEAKKQIGICKNIWYEIKCRKLLSQTMVPISFFFIENRVFIEEEDNPSDKLVIVEENGIDIGGIGNLADLFRLMFIDENAGILK